MPSPAVASESEGGDPETPSAETPDDTVEIEEELADPVFADDGEDFFTGTDDLAEEVKVDVEEMDQSSDDGAAAGGPDFEPTINRGFARLAVVGLDEDDGKEDLRGEFQEVFAEFKLGHYGDAVAKEYLIQEDEDIDPIWGFCGALLLCLGLVVYMRPDGDELIANVTGSLGGLGGLTSD